MQPDPGPWVFDDPQSFNRYAYVLNNPLRYGDDDGETAQDRVNAANRFASQNIAYVSGGGHAGKDPSNGLDCSGLVINSFKADPDNNVGLEGSAASQKSALENNGEYSTDINNAQLGDAIFWSNGSGAIVHTGIVVDIRDGKVYFVHAPRPGKNVNRFYVKVNSPNLGSEKFAGVGRPIESTQSKSSGASAPRSYFERAKQVFYSWFPSFAPKPAPAKPNPEGNPKRPKKPGCLKRRDGTCVD